MSELTIKAPALQGQDYSEGRCSYKIPEGFEFDKVEEGEIILKPRKKELPKTWNECIEILDNKEMIEITNLTDRLGRLLYARNAYWKLAGDWRPNYNGYNGNRDKKHCIRQCGSAFIKNTKTPYGCILMFPTAEMRDTFYENFKDLIHECKELL